MTAFKTIDHCWIPLPDGRRLAARLWLPEGREPVPAILEYLPYRKRDGTAPRDATTYPVFAAEGFAGVRVDIAGTGDSDGVFDDEYSEQELADGEAVIAWVAAQDWCDGAVGIMGISWGGFNGLQLAFRRPPALKAVVTVCSTVDRHADDIHYMGGCLLTDNFNWGAQMSAYLSRPPDPALREDWRAAWLARMSDLPFLAADWLRRPKRDAYWRHGSVCEDWGAIQAPVLAIGGWADAYLNAPLALAENLSTPTKALIGPWEHKYPHIARINPADYHGEAVRWFGRFLRGDANGAETLPAVRAFLQSHEAPSTAYGPRGGEWIAQAEWPSPHIAPKSLFLREDGLGETPAEAEAAAQVQTDLKAGETAAYFCPGMRVDYELCADQAPDDARSRCFDTPPLTAPLDLLGRPTLEIRFSVDKPVAQICARLCDVSPEGASQRISYRPLSLNAHAGPESPEMLEPGREYSARINLNACAWRLKPGHRLRLALSASYWPVLWPAPEDATITLHLAQCRLDLPVLAAGSEIDPQAPAPPRPLPASDIETLRAPKSASRRRMDDSGALVLETEDDFGAQRDLGHGLEVESAVSQRFSVTPGDPRSARHEARWRFAFRRGDWSTRIETHSVMTADESAFHMSRSLVAHEGETLALEKTWRETIPRGVL